MQKHRLLIILETSAEKSVADKMIIRRMREMKCNNCGTENADGQQYCQGCGAALYGQSNMYTQQNQNTYGQQNAGTYAQQNAGTYGQQNLYSQQAYTTPPQQVVYNQRITKENLPYEFQPISMWGYFGYELLFSIPLVGFILLLVFSFGGTKNKNLKNFARSYFCFMIVIIVLSIIFLGSTIGAALSYM